jgi:hypothetical protein
MIATLLTGQRGALSIKQHCQSAGHAMPCVLCLSCSTASPQAMYALPCVLCLSCTQYCQSPGNATPCVLQA